MISKEKFYDLIQEFRNVADDDENTKCTCSNTKCEWHGNCVKCVAIHRHYGQLPNCLQFVIKDKIKDIADIGGMIAVEKEKTSNDYWEYVRKRDKSQNN